MTSLSKRQNFARKRQMLAPDSPDPERGSLVAWWLRKNLGANATKLIQQQQQRKRVPVASDRTIDRILAGEVSDRQAWHLIRLFGWDLANFVLHPILGPAPAGSDGTAYPSHLDTLDHDLRSAAAASSVALRQGLGLAASRHRMASHDDVRAPGSARDLAAEAGVSVVRSPVGKAARELMALCGRLETHEAIGLDQADPRHLQLLEVWRNSGGELTPGFFALMDKLGLADLASLYTHEIKVQHIGGGTIFWTEEQRRSVVGKSIFEVPAAPAFTRVVFDKLSATVASMLPTNTLLTYDTGVARATWKRMAFPFPLSDRIVGSPALQVAA